MIRAFVTPAAGAAVRVNATPFRSPGATSTSAGSSARHGSGAVTANRPERRLVAKVIDENQYLAHPPGRQLVGRFLHHHARVRQHRLQHHGGRTPRQDRRPRRRRRQGQLGPGLEHDELRPRPQPQPAPGHLPPPAQMVENRLRRFRQPHASPSGDHATSTLARRPSGLASNK